MEGISMAFVASLCGRGRSHQTHRNSVFHEVTLQIFDRVLRVVKDGRGQSGIGMAASKDVNEVIERSRPTRRDHRNRYRVGHGSCELAIKTDSRPVAID